MNLKEYRKLKYMSVIQVAEELGITRQHIYSIEKGETYPSRKLAVKIYKWSDCLVTMGELLFPDIDKSVKDNLVHFENWEENEKRNEKCKFHETQLMGNEPNRDVCYRD
ncbi:MAG: helix-turn-helix transcriptional regulator [Syntrophaceae bacterium]